MDEVDAWVTQTLLWRGAESKDLEHDLDEKWDFTHGEYALRLIVSPLDRLNGEYRISIAGLHGMLDGRVLMILLNHIVDSLEDQLSKDAEPVDLAALPWVELASTGASLAGAVCKSIIDEAPEPGRLVPFLPPFVENTIKKHDVTVRLIELDGVQTSAFRNRCRQNEVTGKIAMDAVFALAHAEAVLKNAAIVGGIHYASTIKAYNEAVHWFMPLSCKDQVSD
ncbi:hypothetical protein GYMLUDRAFT_68583 [Collybiopsis luxurians FD-317 M1]|nr:hypothetical protein GYMLUDRAFT_68583 [Collybiopsis luxurians FD-317 M1]